MIEVAIPGAPIGVLRFAFDLEQPVQRDMADDLTTGVYEPTTWNAIRSTLMRGDHAVDVGAHVGVLTCLMAACVGPTGQVDAYEPNERNREKLKEHLALNDLHWVTVHPEAVGERTGRITFYACADNDGGHARWNPGLVEANHASRATPSAASVQLVTLDESLRYAGRIQFIKTDTEGGDFHVLKGAHDIICRDHPAVISEIHRFGMRQLGTDEFTYRQWMRDHGYEATLLAPDGQVRPLQPDETVLGETVFNLLFE